MTTYTSSPCKLSRVIGGPNSRLTSIDRHLVTNYLEMWHKEVPQGTVATLQQDVVTVFICPINSIFALFSLSKDQN